ncbi:MAG: hypothetical protein AAFX93_15255 [Verrucomicrobiota bacterium]
MSGRNGKTEVEALQQRIAEQRQRLGDDVSSFVPDTKRAIAMSKPVVAAQKILPLVRQFREQANLYKIKKPAEPDKLADKKSAPGKSSTPKTILKIVGASALTLLAIGVIKQATSSKHRDEP